MLTTPNFLLKKIELTDSPPDITVVNFNWDTIDINLKEALDKARNWDTFRKAGGDFLGGITTESLFRKTAQTAIPDSTALEIGIKSSNASEVINMWLGKLEGSYALCPSTVMNGALSLGIPGSLRFKDIWLSGSSASESGYTKLPNGFILQWGIGHGSRDVAFPITFPNACLAAFAFGDIRLETNPPYKVKSQVVGVGKSSLRLVSYGYESLGVQGTAFDQLKYGSTTGVANFGGTSKWLAIGY